jgi:hypothetical protein
MRESPIGRPTLSHDRPIRGRFTSTSTAECSTELRPAILSRANEATTRIGIPELMNALAGPRVPPISALPVITCSGGYGLLTESYLPNRYSWRHSRPRRERDPNARRLIHKPRSRFSQDDSPGRVETQHSTCSSFARIAIFMERTAEAGRGHGVACQLCKTGSCHDRAASLCGTGILTPRSPVSALLDTRRTRRSKYASAGQGHTSR